MERRRRKQSLADTLMVWGFVASFLGLFGAACFEAFKIVAVVPAAFQSTPVGLHNPMAASQGDYQPASGAEHMTPRQRAEFGGRTSQP